MAEAINCCYARIAIRSIAQKLYMGIEGVITLSTQSMAQLVVEYSALFENNLAMHLQNQKNSTINVYCPECPPGGTIGHPGGQQKKFLPFGHGRDLVAFNDTGL